MLTTTHGKVLEYLGMTIVYTTKGKVKISIYKYIEKMLNELALDKGGTLKTLASKHLFNVNKEAKKFAATIP